MTRPALRIGVLISGSLIVGISTLAYGQSMVQRCEAMMSSRSGDAGWNELCQGIFAANGTHGPQDQAEAFRRYQRAADLGNVEAQALLGAIYERGWAGVPRDIGRAIGWYRRPPYRAMPARNSISGCSMRRAKVFPRTRYAPGASSRRPRSTAWRRRSASWLS